MKTQILLFLILISMHIHAQGDLSRVKQVMDSIQLQEVVITGTVPLNNKQVESFYKTNTLSTIDNVIERLDGVSLIRRGSYAQEPTLNGFSGGQLDVTIDGMKIFGACTDRMDPITSYIEPLNLKSITVLPGSGGCHNGCNVGGSVDMALQEPKVLASQPWYGSLAMGYESVSNGKIALLSTGYSGEKWQWGLNSAFRNHNSYKDGSRETVPFTQYEKVNFHSVLKYKPDSTQSFKTDILFDLARNVGYASLPMDVGIARAFIAALEYRRVRHTSLTAKLYFNTIFHLMDDSKRDSVFYVTNSVSGQKEIVYMHMDMPGTSSTFGAYGRMDINLGTGNKLKLQADNYTNHSLAEMTMHMRYPEKPAEAPMYLQTWPDITRNVTGLFIQDTWVASRKLRLNLNSRVDYTVSLIGSNLAKEQFSVFGVSLSKNYQSFTKSCDLLVQYSLSDHLLLNLETGYSERAPTISEQFGFYLYNAHDGYDYIGKPGIKPEKSDFGRLVVQFTDTRVKINLSQSLYVIQGYIMGITDATVPPMNFNTNGTKVYANLPGSTVYSANLQVQATLNSNLTFFLLTKYTRGQLKSGDPLPLIAPLNNVLVATYKQPRWSCDLENETASAQNRINTSYGELRSRAYTKFNIKFSYQFMFLKPVVFDCSLAVTNVLNARYYEHLDWGQVYRPGRSFDILFRLSF